MARVHQIWPCCTQFSPCAYYRHPFNLKLLTGKEKATNGSHVVHGSGEVFFCFFIKICLQFRCTFSNLLSQLSCSVLFNCALHDCWASRRPFSPGVQGISHAYLKILHWIVAFRRASRLKWTFENQPNIQKCQFMPKKCEWPCFGHHPSS